MLTVYFRVPCKYHNKHPLFPYTTFTGHFSNGHIVVFSLKCEQTVCCTQAKGWACRNRPSRWWYSSIHNLAARRGPVVIATPRPLFPRKKDPLLFGQVWMDAENLPPPSGVQTLHHRARTESLHECAIVATGPLCITQVNFSPQMGPCQRSEVKRLVMSLLPRRTWFDPRSVLVGFVVDKVVLAHVYLRLLRLHTPRIIPSALHFIPPALFHLPSTLIFSMSTSLQGGQSSKTCHL